MTCNHLTRGARPASLWHRFWCIACRRYRRADKIVAFALACRKAEGVPDGAIGRTLASLSLPYSIPRPRRERWTRFGRGLRKPVGILAAGTALLGYAWTRYIDIDPDMPIPASTVSGPNAFTDFTHAAALLREDKRIGDMLTQRKDRLDKAKKEHAAQEQNTPPPGMGGGMMGGGQVRATSNLKQLEHVFSKEERDDVVRINGPALAALRNGFSKPCGAPAIRSFNAQGSYTSGYRALARLLILESQTEVDRGDPGKGVEAALDAVELGVKVQRNGRVVDKLAGTACESIGRSALWDMVDRLSASDALNAALRLEKIESGRTSTADALTEEKWSMLAATMEMMRKPGWRGTAFSTDGQSTNFPAYVMMLPYSKTRVVRLMSSHYDRLIAAARGPYSRDDSSAAESDIPNVPLLQALLPEFGQLNFRDYLDSTENRLLATTLALHAYKQEHGSYPPSLTWLVPKLVSRIPQDPFAPGAGLRYRMEGDKYVLWSVGPDGTDQVGTPTRNVNATSEYSVNSVTPESPGDIVAGVNRN